MQKAIIKSIITNVLNLFDQEVDFWLLLIILHFKILAFTMNNKLKSALIAFLFLSMFSCTTEKGAEENSKLAQAVIGNWDVQWITSPDEGMNTDNINLTMNGKMHIKEDNQITIEAYGYKDCIFGVDTLIHTLNWEISGDTLNLKNPNDVFGIPYIIKESTDKKIKLQLLEDVFLFLTKSNN